MTKLRKQQKRKGFTLLEMSIVIFIIALLILIIVPNITKQKDHATTVHSEALQTMVQTQVNLYLEDQETDADSGKANSIDKEASLEDLKDGGYLTEKQFNKATATLVIKDNHVDPKANSKS